MKPLFQAKHFSCLTACAVNFFPLLSTLTRHLKDPDSSSAWALPIFALTSSAASAHLLFTDLWLIPHYLQLPQTMFNLRVRPVLIEKLDCNNWIVALYARRRNMDKSAFNQICQLQKVNFIWVSIGLLRGYSLGCHL